MAVRDGVRFTFGDTKYEYHGYVDGPSALLIRQHAGLSVVSFLNGVLEGDSAALLALVFIARRQAGEKVTWDEVVEAAVGENDLIALVESVERIPGEESADEDATAGPAAADAPVADATPELTAEPTPAPSKPEREPAAA